MQHSAKWAGFSEKDGNLLAALVGGVEFEQRGKMRVNFGNYSPVTPVRLYEIYTKSAYRKLCGDRGLLDRWLNRRHPDLDDSDYFQSKGKNLLSTQLMNALARLPDGEREAACDRLAGAMSLTKFIDEMEERFDQLYMMSQNPHLPDSERERLEQKTRKLIDHTFAVLRIKNLKQDSLNSVRSNIMSEAGKGSVREGQRGTVLSNPGKVETPFNECEDFTICGRQ